MTLEKNHLEIWNYLKEIKVGMLTTSNEGYLSSRPMFLVQEAYEGVIWLFADRNARKIMDVNKNPHVNLNFMLPSDGDFISLSGVGTVQEGGSKFEEFWTEDVKIWFANSENPKREAVLIRIDVDQAEFWDSDKGILKRVFEYAKAKVTGSRPDVGENKVLAQ
jgi:general stress protein 26